MNGAAVMDEDEERYRKALAYCLTRRRLVAHLTQAQLARGGGLSPSEVQHIERGRRHPKTETQRRLCAALGITLLELMAEVDRVQREWERQGR